MGNSKKILTHIPIRQSIIFPNDYINTNDKYISKLVEEIINLDKEIKKIRLKLKDSDFRDSELRGKYLEKLIKLNDIYKKIEKHSKKILI